MVSFFAKNEVGRYFIAKHPVNLNCTPRPRGVKENFVRFSEFSKILQKISCEVLNLAIFCIVGILLKTSRGFGVRKMFGCYLFFLILLFLFFFLFMKENETVPFRAVFSSKFSSKRGKFFGKFSRFPSAAKLLDSVFSLCYNEVYRCGSFYPKSSLGREEPLTEFAGQFFGGS